MTLQDVLTALRNADAAGDVAAATRLAQIAESMQGASETDQRERELKERLRELRSQKFTPETTFGGNVKEFAKGVVPGAIGLLETAGTGISALLPEDAEKAAREKIKEIAGVAKRPFEASEGYEDSIGRNLGQGIGSFLPFAPLALLGPAGIAAGVGLGVSAGAGEARERAEEDGADKGQRGTATALGTIPGGFDAAVNMALAAFPGGAGRAVGFIKRALISGGVEGATEAAQQVAQNAIAKGVYKPEQGIVEGSGEQGAYGAGVGVISSLLLDALVPGRRRGPRSEDKPAEDKPADKPADPLQLGYSGAPFTPMAMPDGSVITTREEYEQYAQGKDRAARERDEDRRTSDPLANLSGDERELARRGKEAALTETFAGAREGETGLLYPDTPGQIEMPFGRSEPQDPATVQEPEGQAQVDTGLPEGQLTLDLQGMMTVDDLINEMYAEDARKAKAKEEKDKADKEKAEKEKARLKLDSDLAELTGRLDAKQEKTSQDKRLELLLPIIESDTKNIPKAFVQTLEREGFANTNLTDRERQLISRAYDVRLAEPIAPEVEPSAPTQNNPMEALIPEKTDKVAPGQLSFPGMGRKGEAKADAAPEAESEQQGQQEEKPFATKLTPEVLEGAGLPKQSGFYKQLLGKDMADPVQQPDIADIFARVRANPNVGSTTKDAIERLAMQAFGGLAKQQELFKRRGPRGTKSDQGDARGSTGTGTGSAGTGAGGSGGGANAGNDNAATGTRTAGDQSSAGSGQPKGGSAGDSGRTETSKPSGLGNRGQSVRNAGAGKGGKPDTLTTKPTATKPATDKPGDKREPKPGDGEKRESKPKSKADFNSYEESRAQGQADHAIRTLAADGYLNLSKGLTSVEQIKKLIKDAQDGKLPDFTFGAAGANGPGTGGKFARSFYESLSKDERNQFSRDFQQFLFDELNSKEFLDRYNAQQRAAREEFASYNDASPLFKDARQLATALHPEVVQRLKANNLVGALQFIGGMDLGRASLVARRLAEAVRGVDVEIVDFKNPPALLKSSSGDLSNASGAYVTTANGRKVVFLDSNTGMDVWSLLHESTHPLVNDTLNNATHPLTKQLQQLFNDVKDSLDTAYGATNLKEFAAEALSNPAFQQKLAVINPKGEAITAWQRFTHAVKNFLRSVIDLQPKGMNSALDAADYMIEAIIDGHTGTSGSLGTVSLLNKGGAYLDAIAQRAESLPLLNREKVARFLEFFTGTTPNAVKNIVRQSLPLNALVDVAQKYIPMAPKVDVLVSERGGAENRRNQGIEAVVNHATDWAKRNPTKLDGFNRVVYESTLAQVDPTKPRSDYVGKTDSSGNKKDAAWDAMRKDWDSLGESGQALYRQMRDQYKKMYDDIRRVLDNRIDETVEDKAARTNLKAEIYKRLFESGHIEPYFPLTRTGKYWLSYSLDGEFYVEAFETGYQRDMAVKEVTGEGAKDIAKFSNLNQINYRKAPATSFVNNVLRTLEANKVDTNVTEEIMRMFLNTLPETSFAQSFRRRKNTSGFQRDAINAMKIKAYNLSRQLSNMEYGAKLEKLRTEINEYVRTQGSNEEAVAMANELGLRIDYAISPQVPQWSKLATSFGFNMTLGFNVSSAIVNLSQIPLVVMPYLGGKYGYSNTTRALGRATRYFTGSGFAREVEMVVPITDAKGNVVEKTKRVRAFPSLDNYDFSKKDAPKHLKVLSEIAARRGQLNRSQVYDILDVDESQSVLTKVNAASGFVFHHGERMNRQVSLIAAYELELQRMLGDGKKLTDATQQQQEAAADYAIYVTELTNGGTVASAAPRIAQSGLGKVIFMYKRYGVSMYYMLFKTARDAFFTKKPDGMSDKEFKEFTSTAKRQIAGIYASAALMAGAQGLPLFGMLAMMYNLILKEEDDDDFDTAARKYLGEGIFNGAINATLGVNVAQRISLSDLLYRDMNTRPSDSVILSLFETLGGPVLGSALRVERGLGLISEGHTMRGVEQMLPSAFSNGFKAVRFGTEGANTLRGDPIVSDIGPSSVFAQFFGFAPAEYSRQLEVNADLKAFERNTLERRTKLLRKYYVAMSNGDGAEASDVMADILKFNERYPTNAITPKTIDQSMKQHLKTTQEMYHGITLNKAMRGRLMEMASEYDDD